MWYSHLHDLHKEANWIRVAEERKDGGGDDGGEKKGVIWLGYSWGHIRKTRRRPEFLLLIKEKNDKQIIAVICSES